MSHPDELWIDRFVVELRKRDPTLSLGQAAASALTRLRHDRELIPEVAAEVLNRVGSIGRSSRQLH